MTQYIRAKAPLRISFAGGGTDIPEVFREIDGGAVLVSTINKYSYVTISARSDDQVHIRSLDFNQEVNYSLKEDPVYDGVLDLAKACIAHAGSDSGLDICVETEAPPGSGLGSSSSMLVSLLAGLRCPGSVTPDKHNLAQDAYHVERVKLAISGGWQDQYACAFGGFNLIEFHPGNTKVTPLRLRGDVLNDLESHCMLCFTGGTRLSANLIDKQVTAFKDPAGTSREGVLELKALAYEANNLLLEGRTEDFGHLLHQAGIAKKKMNPETTDPHIDALYEAAHSLGALGGKILGAGGGGFLLLFVPSDRKHMIRRELEGMGGRFMTFSFCNEGVQTWTSSCP